MWGFTDIQQLVLHRIDSAQLLDEPTNEPPGFNLDDYIQQGGFDYAHGKTIRLIARFEPFAAQALLETPLSNDQTHQTSNNGNIEIHAKVNDSFYPSQRLVVAPNHFGH
ncbi:MAG: WYL domain-containing protein [Wenzhouxiangella sp.]